MALLDDVRAPQPRVTTHPPAPERLFVNLDTAALPPDNIVFSYCLVILQFCVVQYTSAPPVDEDSVRSPKRTRSFCWRMRHVIETVWSLRGADLQTYFGPGSIAIFAYMLA